MGIIETRFNFIRSGLEAAAGTLRFRRAAPPADEPGAALFHGLRIRLTLWYSGVLAMALLVCGLVLYFALQDLTLRPVTSSLRQIAEFRGRDWQRELPRSCGDRDTRTPPPAPNRGGAPNPYYEVCFDLQGNVIREPGPIPGPEAFLAPTLISNALASGSATDVVDGGEGVGPVYRLAVAVQSPSTGAPLGVFQVGQSVASQTNLLQLLRYLLLAVAILALLISIAVGSALAERALVPARVAFARQRAFIADASHQLRTPLTLLRADAEVLLRQRDRLDPRDAELLEDIVAETAHMDTLATNLLTLARLDSGRSHLELDVIDLAELASDIHRRVTTVAAQKEIAIEESHVAHPRVLADRHAIEQAVLILVDNALKYTPAGGTVTLRTETGRGVVKLIVEDTGAGIEKADLGRLGERFFRVDPSRSHTAGTGLGLTIARGIAQAHGGAIEHDSAPGRGTRATLTLPAATRGPNTAESASSD